MTHHDADQGGSQPTDQSPSGSAAERLARAREALADAEASVERLGSAEYRASLVGTIGRQPQG